MTTDRTSVIAGLAAVSVGVAVYLLVLFVQQERRKSDLLTCQSNLRQIGQAMQMYVADNEGFLPGADQWHNTTIPSLPLSGCPAAEPIPRLNPPMRGTGGGVTGYAFSAALAGESAVIAGHFVSTNLAYAKLTHPQTTIAVFDYTSGIPTTIALNIYGGMYGGWPTQLSQGWKRHNGGGNYMFCDGHVGWFPESQILVTELDICDGDKTRPNFCVD